MHRVVSALFAVALVAAAPSTASAQVVTNVNWDGLFVGAHVGTTFRVPGFSTMEAGPNFYNSPLDVIDADGSGGAVIGLQAGWNKTLPHNLLVGGEFSFGKLGYSGSGVSTLFGGDTEAKVRGGMGWTAVARVGYRITERAMPYFAIGFIGTTAHVSVFDDCTVSPCGGGTVDADGSAMGDDMVWGFGFEHRLPTIIRGKQTSLNISWMNSDFRFDARATDGTYSWNFNPHIPKSVLQVNFNIYLEKWSR